MSEHDADREAALKIFEAGVSNYTAPEPGKSAFTCPHCGVLAQQYGPRVFIKNYPGASISPYDDLRIGRCLNCSRDTIWYQERMVEPLSGNAPLPNPHLPPEVRVDYLEARTIATLSARGAAALLRLCIQKLCEHILGTKPRTIDDGIALLIERGLDPLVKDMLDGVRVTGNQAVHVPDRLDVRDDPHLVSTLFWLVNEIAEELIVRPQRVQALKSRFPESVREAVERRDAKAMAKRDGAAVLLPLGEGTTA